MLLIDGSRVFEDTVLKKTYSHVTASVLVVSAFWTPGLIELMSGPPIGTLICRR